MKYADIIAPVDVVPEHFSYRDDGCEVSSSCLKCPLPQCKYDDPTWFQREKRKERDGDVLATMRRNHLSVPQVATRFEISQRTVFRILSRAGYRGPAAAQAA